MCVMFTPRVVKLDLPLQCKHILYSAMCMQCRLKAQSFVDMFLTPKICMIFDAQISKASKLLILCKYNCTNIHIQLMVHVCFCYEIFTD